MSAAPGGPADHDADGSDAGSREADAGRIVILGVGNLLLTDEGVGPTTIAHLGERWRFPDHVELVDGATAGLELINVFQSAGHIVVVDTVLGGAEPGAVYRFLQGCGGLQGRGEGVAGQIGCVFPFLL